MQKHRITLEYCPKCHWLMRAAWLAQEILTTFVDDMEEVGLKPSEVAGKFTISLDNEVIFDRKSEGHFPEAKDIKQIIRDKIDPSRNLGHGDKK